MRVSMDALGYAPPETMWGGDSTEDGYYALDHGIARTLMGRSHLGYVPGAASWGETANDCGYYAINASIGRALRNLSGRC